MELANRDITEAVIGAAFSVHDVLGYGFLEKVYQRAMQVELRSRGLRVTTEAEIRVNYKGVEVGVFRADLWVEDRVIVEIKVAWQSRTSPTTNPNFSTNSKPQGSKSACSSTSGGPRSNSNDWSFEFSLPL